VKSLLLIVTFQPLEDLYWNIYSLGSDSLHSEPVFFLLFPKEEEREKGVKRTIDWWQGDPTATYIKVVDTETGKFQMHFKNTIYCFWFQAMLVNKPNRQNQGRLLPLPNGRFAKSHPPSQKCTKN
jgi:hypothetical protein